MPSEEWWRRFREGMISCALSPPPENPWGESTINHAFSELEGGRGKAPSPKKGGRKEVQGFLRIQWPLSKANKVTKAFE